MATANPFPLQTPPTEFHDILAAETALVLPSFTLTDAQAIGELIRDRLATYSQPTIVDVSLSTGPQSLFRSAVNATAALPSVIPDNDEWIRRKQNSVIRFAASSYALHYKFGRGDLALFKAKLFLSDERAGAYALHGGGFPIRVANVEGIVGIVTVSGLKHDQDHQIIVQSLKDYLDAYVKKA